MASRKSYQQIPFVSVNQIIQTLIFRLASHPWLREPIIVTENGQKLSINRFRNFNGKELKNGAGLTLSVYPYTYVNDPEQPMTLNSKNATVQFRQGKGAHETLGANGQDPTSMLEAVLSVCVRIDAFGFAQKSEGDNDITAGQQTVFEFDEVEMILRQYIDLVARVLMGNDMRKLPRLLDNQPLLTNSWLDQMNYPTSNWVKGPNSLLHSASLVWQAVYHVPHEWRLPTRYVPIDMVDGLLALGSIEENGEAVSVFYDTVSLKFVRDDRTEIARDDLNVSGTVADTLNAEFMALVDGAPKGLFDFSMYHKVVEDGWEAE